MKANSGPLLLRVIPWKGNQFDVGVEWPEFRTIDKITVRFADKVPARANRVLEYWEGLTRLQGSWKPPPPGSDESWEGLALTLTFPRLRTDKVRLRLWDGMHVAIETLRIYGPSKWRGGKIRIEW